jgi:hypothetical protein
VPPLGVARARPHPGPALAFGADTFAFRNDSRVHHKGKPDLYASRCFVLARAVVQFQRFARFEPAAPRLTAAEYTELVRRVTRRAPWRPPLPVAERIVIPGFESLHELTREAEAAVKAGLPRRLWTILHWTNWRIIFPLPSAQQERVAAEMVAELQAGRPVQLLVSDFPRIRFNHSVLAFDFKVSAPDSIDFSVYDPNDPTVPGVIRFDRRVRRYRPAPLCGVNVPHFRSFRMYYSPFL